MSTSPSSSSAQEGYRLYQAGDAVGARPHLEQAVRDDPASGHTHLYLGIVRCQLGDFAGGVQALREAARLLPSDASARYNLGLALERVGDTPGARTALEEALVLEPGNARARAALGRLPGAAPQPPAAAPPPPTEARPASGGLAPIGGGGGLAPIGGGAPSAPTLTPVGGGASAPSGLGSVGGGSSGGGTPAHPAAYGGPPPMGPAGGTPPVRPGIPAPPPPDIHSLTSGGALPTAALNTNMFSREPTAGERMARGVGWGSLMAQVWLLVNAVFLFMFGVLGQRPGEVGLAFVGFMIIILISSLGFAMGGAILGAVIAALGADEDQGATIGGIFGIGFLILRSVALMGFGGFQLFGILLGIPFWWWIGSWVGKMTAEKVNERVGV